MGRELYIAVEYDNMSFATSDVRHLDPIFVNKNKVRFEKLIQGFDNIDKEIFDHLSDFYKVNWIVLIDNLKKLQKITGRLKIKKKEFMLHINELYKLTKYPPWQLAKKNKSDDSSLPYYEKLKEIKIWLEKHEAALYVLLDYWDNTSGYDAYPPFEMELELGTTNQS